MNFKDVKIGNKLILGFSSILLVAMIIGYIGYNGMQVIHGYLDDVTETRLPSIRSLLIISEADSEIDAGKNALLSNNITPEIEKEIYEQHFKAAKERADEAMRVFEALPHTPEEEIVWKEFILAWNDWWQHQEEFLVLAKKYSSDKTEKAYKEMSDYALITVVGPFTKAENLINSLIKINSKLTIESKKNAEESSRLAVTFLFVVMLIGALISIFLAIIISNAITRPLAKGVKLADAIAKGDLTVTIDIDQKDEVGQLAIALKAMVEKLKGIVLEISNGVTVLGTSASEILTTVTEVSTGAAETATSVSETTTTIEEVRQTAMVSNQKAQFLRVSSQKAADSVDKGRDSINEVIVSMKKIDNQMNLISETVLKLADQNRTIGEITSSVTDIADQSNLLAVNAAIEAAKAGEQGRGFTVVALEIRSLADQSKKATAQVKEILNEINKSVNQTVGVTEQGARTVEEGRKLVGLSGEVIEVLADNVEEASQASIQISASNQQQMAGMEQIVPAMENIKVASQQNVLGIRQAQAAAHDLNSLGQNLKEIVAKFKI